MITNTKTKYRDLPDYLLQRHFIDFETLKILVKGKFKERRDYQKNRQKNWPSAPDRIYKNKGWKGWCDFLSKEKLFKNWLKYSELKKQVKGKFKNQKDYQKNRKRKWPSNPDKVYKNKGWKGYCDFLGK